MNTNIPLSDREQVSQQRGPELENRAPEPKGVIRRNLKMQVYLGTAVLFIVATALSSLRHKPVTKQAQQGQPPDPMIQESNTNIEEMKRNLEKQQHEAAAQVGSDPLRARPLYGPTGAADMSGQPSTLQYGPTGLPAGYECGAGQPCPSPQAGYSPYQQQLSPQEQERLQFEQQERELTYKARFASNLAYSQSRGIIAPASLPNANPLVATSTQGPPSETVLATPVSSGQHVPSQYGSSDRGPQSTLVQPNPPLQAPNETQGKPGSQRPAEININSAAGQPYVLYEGTIIETALMNRLDGDASGPVKVLVTNPLYSHDHQHVLIPEGTVVFGETHKIGTAGFGQQRRLAVVFHRMIMPDGYSVDLDQFLGLNQIGETGLKDKVNNHYIEIFGTSIALGLIAGAAEISSTGGTLTGSGTDAFKYGAASSVSQSATTILDRFINIPPTITVREGHRVKVYISQDLLLPAVENHTIPSTF